jgi:hypothetical protein
MYAVCFCQVCKDLQDANGQPQLAEPWASETKVGGRPLSVYQNWGSLHCTKSRVNYFKADWMTG